MCKGPGERSGQHVGWWIRNTAPTALSVHMADIANRSQHSGFPAAPALDLSILLNTEACTTVTRPWALEVWGQFFGLDLQYSCGVWLESSVRRKLGINNKQLCPERGLALAAQLQ